MPANDTALNPHGSEYSIPVFDVDEAARTFTSAPATTTSHPQPRIDVKTFICPPDHVYPLHIIAKRYTFPRPPPSTEEENEEEGLTLLVLHSTSFHKETWEPTLRELAGVIFRNRQGDSQHDSEYKKGGEGRRDVKADAKAKRERGRLWVDTAWVVECPNHGESAVLNRSIVRGAPFFGNWNLGCEKYAQAVHRFIRLAPRSAGMDFWRRGIKLVGLGHSLGGVAVSTLSNLHPLLPLRTLILVEPLLSPGPDGNKNIEALRKDLIAVASKRKNRWPSRADASAYFERLHARIRKSKQKAQNSAGDTKDPSSHRLGGCAWDSDVVGAFVKYGVCESEDKAGGVELACTREEEVNMYSERDGATKAVGDLDVTCGRLPVHVVFGEAGDYVPKNVQDALVDPRSGRRFESVIEMGGVGHLIPQQSPRALASALAGILVREWDSNGWSWERSAAAMTALGKRERAKL
ncbi:hypothetical protein CONPUDRAFT_164564 [Coniophora puteana RWD-64-598 SS2]|uniref:AB hydrolase-1 domain-containing protein n=1 Tax=Coniophora puteana (strain RWD-64-598) TaxID=741705 RepID=A0A5M3MRL3_CONPW|nr:uncharacterized protein CONPUDRAFT_164564 [Coniophora puteana RWD-64-598 SS2]EIW81792.1 hypothetical protein CONPUDRAFT_164564 [Coniophora puteana RWD-64-598 SS2]